MIEKLTTEQRKKIYEEEKAKLEGDSCSCESYLVQLLLGANIISLFFLLSLIKISRKKFQPKIDDLRKAYPGL